MVKIRVFCPKESHVEIEKMMKVEALYDAFVIGEVQADQIKLIREKFPVEEMSNYYNTINLKTKQLILRNPAFLKIARSCLIRRITILAP